MGKSKVGSPGHLYYGISSSCHPLKRLKRYNTELLHSIGNLVRIVVPIMSLEWNLKVKHLLLKTRSEGRMHLNPFRTPQLYRLYQENLLITNQSSHNRNKSKHGTVIASLVPPYLCPQKEKLQFIVFAEQDKKKTHVFLPPEGRILEL